MHNLIEKYLEGHKDLSENIEKAKKELAFLKKTEKQGKLTKQGERKMEQILNYLHMKGIFDY